jgi:hypothetical protein
VEALRASTIAADKNPLAVRPAASQQSDSAVIGPTEQARLGLADDPRRLAAGGQEVSSKSISERFVSVWHPKYDDIESDEEEYQYLVAKTELICSSEDLMPPDIFKRIIHWKSPRVKGKIEWDKYQTYAMEVKASIGEPNIRGIERLENLYGIGVPVASTILHFVHPDKVPIIDKRTVGVLNHFNSLASKGTGLKDFQGFMDAVLDLHRKLPNFTLREIDRAMFAFHKSNPQIFGNLSNPKNLSAGSC